MSWDAKWKTLGREKRFESTQQRQFLINSSDEDSEDEEWIQQLERDYGKRQNKRKTKWTNLEKLLLAALACAIIFISILMTAIFYSRYKHGETLLEFTLGGQQFCNEICCVEASHRVSTYMDAVTDPCEDFYDHACGSWLKTESLPSTHTKWTSFGQVSDQTQRKLKDILERLELGAENSESLQKVKKYYQSCLKKDFIESHSNESLIWLINHVGGWAITTNTSSWNDEQWNFDQVLSKIHHLKSMPLFYMFVAADDKDSTKNIIQVLLQEKSKDVNVKIQIEQSGVTLPDESIYNRSDTDPVIKSYKNLMLKVGKLLGADPTQTEKQMNEIFDFEKSLAEIYESKSTTQKTDQIYHKVTLADLQTMCPAIPWLDYMNSMFAEPVKSSEEIIVYTPTYFKKMSDLVIKTERRIIANYMVWHLIKPILPLLSKPYRNAALELAGQEIGLKGSVESWKNCVTKTDSVFGLATGHLFVKEIEKDGMYSTMDVERMLEMIKEEFMMNLKNVNWMDKQTKKRAKEKEKGTSQDVDVKNQASAILNMIGYPSWIKDIKRLDKYYENFTVSENPLKNYLSAREFYHEKTMLRRGQPVQRNEWHMAPTEVNAYYNAPNNYIAFPVGILQPPFYDHGYPLSINYGALGFIMAHELTHGFDSQGRHFDKFGNMAKWWTNQTTLDFYNRTECIEKQYKKYDQNKDSDLSLAENLADNGGLKMAFNAYKAHAYMRKEDKSLPGLKITNDQLFFLSFAQTWCTVSTNERKLHSQLYDSHSSEKTRVNVALMNSKDFSKAYSCPVGSRMNPKERCAVW